MCKRSPAAGLVAIVVFFALAVAAPRATAEEPRPLGGARDLIGVEMGSSPTQLTTAGRAAGTDCVAAPRRPGPSAAGAGGQTAYVCLPPPVRAPFAARATYWYESGCLARVYLVEVGSSTSFGTYQAYWGALDSFRARFGTPATLDDLPPQWGEGRPASDSKAVQAIVEGRATFRARWPLDGAAADLFVRGEGGRAILVASVVADAASAAPCDPRVVRDALLDLFPPADDTSRARAARQLGACRMSRAAGALAAARARDPSPVVRGEALRAEAAIGHPPDADALAALAADASEPVARAAREIQEAQREAATIAEAAAKAKAKATAKAAAPPAAAVATPTSGSSTPDSSAAPATEDQRGTAAAAVPASGIAEPPVPAATAPRPWSGTPLTMAASTVAGATLMRNLGLMGGQGLSTVTPQLLLGSAGAIIGFGTAWGVSRIGFRPSVDQAAWFANVAAWGTLAGLTAWSASGSTNPKVEYGALALGEAAGLGLGALSAYKWRWNGPQIALADSLVMSAALGAAGIPLLRDRDPQITTTDAIGLPLIMTAAAIAAHEMDPTTNDLKLMTFGALAGGWTGGLVAAGAIETAFLGSRQSRGGVMTGAGVGFLGSAVAGAFVETDGKRLGVASGGLLAGNLLGLGLGMSFAGFTHENGAGATFSDEERNRWALPAGLAGAAMSAAAYAYAPRLQLGPRATAMTVEGALYGSGVWWFALAAAARGPATDIDRAKLQGGMLTGAALGGIAGLVSSRWFAPDEAAQVTAAGATTLGMAGGLGVARLTTSDSAGADFLGVTLGAGLGFAGGALAAHHTRLRAPDVGAGVAGIGFGALIGTLAPSLRDDTWTSDRSANGGAWLGLALGGAGATAAAHLADASGGEVMVASGGATLGLLTGLGAGLFVPCDAGACTSQAPRIGTVAGALAGATTGLLLDRRLHLAEGLGEDAVTLGMWGGAFGIADGLLLAGALDPSGLISETSGRQLGGGVLMLGSAELAAGLVISKRVALRRGDTAAIVAGRVAGGMIGLGTAMLARGETGRADTLATLGGSLAGLGAAVTTEVASPLDATDGAATALGAGAGAILGTLAPTLGAERWDDTSARRRGGGFLLGLGAGAVTGAALRHGTAVPERTVKLTALGGADGLVSGLGLGLLFEPTDSSRGARVGTFAGTAAGLGMGALVLPRLALDDRKATITGLAAAAVGGWTGAWLPSLGHASADDVEAKRIQGGLMAGAGLATAAGLLAEPVLDPDPDLVGNALALDALFSVAGAGAGALASTRHDAPVWGMLGAGSAGLVLGGALHETIGIGEADAPLLTLAAGEGLWLGGWLPTALYGPGSVTERQRAGGLAAGGAGALGLATLASSRLEIGGATAGYTALGSAIGASLGGGIALASPALHDRRGAGIMLGGTVLGLGTGAVLAPRLSLAPPAAVVGATFGGAALGVTESLLFAWSARAAGNAEYGGAALLGGGIGATLGLAVAATPPEQGGSLPAAAGFAAWGAWMGSFTGALIHNDSHEIVLGGLLGANAGFLAGYALLRTDTVEPSDFGWLSLFGALGTVVGAGAGAPFSTRAEPAPVLAGLAIGPAVGMLGGAMLLPKLRRLIDRPTGAGTAFQRRQPRGLLASEQASAATSSGGAQDDPTPDRRSAILSASAPPPFMRRLRHVVEVTQWSPLVGALPAASETGPAPLLFGLTGLWR